MFDEELSSLLIFYQNATILYIILSSTAGPPSYSAFVSFILFRIMFSAQISSIRTDSTTNPFIGEYVSFLVTVFHYARLFATSVWRTTYTDMVVSHIHYPHHHIAHLGITRTN